MNIDEMKPGHELDALVAEKVMGHDFCPIHHGYFCCGRQKGRYSTDIAAAWKVVEHMIEKYGIKAHNGFTLVRQDAGDDPVPDLLWYCEFGNPAWQDGDGYTAPEAICKAALKAVTDENS